MAWEDMPDDLLDALFAYKDVDWESLSLKERIATNCEFHRLVTDAGYLSHGYKVRPLTAADVNRAAETVLTIGAIPTLKHGVVAFESGLEGGLWYEGRQSAYHLEQYLVVEIPEQLDLEHARVAVLDGLEDRRVMIRDHHEEGDDKALELRALELEGAISEAVA
jgi:hypothetical protein